MHFDLTGVVERRRSLPRCKRCGHKLAYFDARISALAVLDVGWGYGRSNGRDAALLRHRRCKGDSAKYGSRIAEASLQRLYDMEAGGDESTGYFGEWHSVRAYLCRAGGSRTSVSADALVLDQGWQIFAHGSGAQSAGNSAELRQTAYVLHASDAQSTDTLRPIFPAPSGHQPKRRRPG